MLLQSRLPCDDCGSSDAKAEYEDNFYCFSCGTSTLKSKEKSFFNKLDNTPHKGAFLVSLPKSSTSELPKKALKWLLTYYVDNKLQEQYGIKYVHQAAVYTQSGSRIILNERVLLPCYNNNKLMWYQARSLNKEDTPKYYTFGDKQELFWSTTPIQNNTKIVITEDMLSAIRVGEHLQAVSLQGTKINDKNLLTLAKKYDTIIIWLDGDRSGRDGAKVLMKKFSLLVNNVHNISTTRDPKCLADSEILSHLKKM